MALFDWLTADRPHLRDAYEDLKFMLKRGDEMFAASTGRLLDNEILDVDLELLDEDINARERHLRIVVRETISAGSSNLVDSLKLLGVVHEAERIGDLAKTISQVSEMANRPRLGEHVLPFRDVRDRIVDMFLLTREGFEGQILAHAEEVLQRHDVLKGDVRGRVADLATGEGLTANEAVVLALGARMMGRVSSHLANIASAIVFPYEDLRRTKRAGDDG